MAVADPLPVSWPVDLPDCAATWQESETPSTIRTDMDAGPPKVRRRFTGIWRRIEVSMNLTKDQFIILRDFYDNECAQGVNWHTFRHPYTNEIEQFRFVEPPALTSMSALAASASMKWEQLPFHA